MSKSTIEVMTCDRCGGSEEIRQSAKIFPWSSISAIEVNGPFQIGTRDRRADLCPSCTVDLRNWWEAGAARPGGSS